MYIYLLSQIENDDYDTYDSIIVCAENEQEAKKIHPYGSIYKNSEAWESTCWCSSPDNVEVELIGIAIKGLEKGIILGSFNAG